MKQLSLAIGSEINQSDVQAKELLELAAEIMDFTSGVSNALVEDFYLAPLNRCDEDGDEHEMREQVDMLSEKILGMYLTQQHKNLTIYLLIRDEWDLLVKRLHALTPNLGRGLENSIDLHYDDVFIDCAAKCFLMKYIQVCEKCNVNTTLKFGDYY